MNKIILVDATAVKASGALTILMQFLKHIETYSCEDEIYYIFSSLDFTEFSSRNVFFIKIGPFSWLDRIKWDRYGFQQWIASHQISPNLIVSFQNTTVRCKYDIPQLIYYHQPLPFSQHCWNIFDHKELKFYLYKTFYPYFVSAYMNAKTHVVVQIPSIKKSFLKRFKVADSNVHVLPPNISLPKYGEIAPIELDEHIHLIYPATPLVYKNHIRIIEALHKLSAMHPDLLTNIRVHFTFDKADDKKIMLMIRKYGLCDNIIFDGVIPYQTLLASYKSMKALLFPSFIETFGLPLIEAAYAGIPIIVSDLPYSRDVVGKYTGSTFVEYDDTDGWANAIKNICVTNNTYTPFLSTQKNSWITFFELINQLKK